MSDETTVAIACQGGGSHTAVTAGVLRETLLELPERYEITALSGTSGGAICAAIAWDGLRRDDPGDARDRLAGFWDELAADTGPELLANDAALWGRRLTGGYLNVRTNPNFDPVAAAVRRDLRRTIERYVTFDSDAPASPPHLFVGAVAVESGTFEVFEDGEDGVASLMASTAVPTLFRSVEVGDETYWDGLFSQNPPIRQFTTEVPPEEKPDEIWIVRISPVERDDPLRTLADIRDRRQELTANISLQQEIHTIEAVNDLIQNEVIDDEDYKIIEVSEVSVGADLDLYSKRDLDPDFLARLRRRGRRRASEFWT